MIFICAIESLKVKENKLNCNLQFLRSFALSNFFNFKAEKASKLYNTCAYVMQLITY